MATKDDKNFNFKQAFEKLEEINNWFSRDDIDLDLALERYKEGVKLITEAKQYLKRTENEFIQIQKDLQEDKEGVE